MGANSNVYERLLGARAVATGSPVGDALENINTTTLDNGARCYVTGGAGVGEWQFIAGSTATADGTTIVAPVSGGAGRWFNRAAANLLKSCCLQVSGSPSANSPYTLTAIGALDGFVLSSATRLSMAAIPAGRFEFIGMLNVDTATDTTPDLPLNFVLIRPSGPGASVTYATATTTRFGTTTTTDLNLIVHTIVDLTAPGNLELQCGPGPSGNVTMSNLSRLTVKRIGPIPA